MLLEISGELTPERVKRRSQNKNNNQLCMWPVWLVFCDCGFHSACPLMYKDKRLMEASWWERLTEGKTGSYSLGQGHAQQIFNPVFCWRVGLCSLPVVYYSRGNGGNGDLLLSPTIDNFIFFYPCKYFRIITDIWSAIRRGNILECGNMCVLCRRHLCGILSVC